LGSGPRGRTLGGATTGARRLSTETKHATKTTEFYAYLATIAGVLIAGNVIEGEGGPDIFSADKVWLYITILTLGYMLSRGIAKSGSREPYWEGGHNEASEKDFGDKRDDR
jgi:hypothetical protein